MPSTTTTIDRDQREGLYELVRNHLGGIGDIWIALEQKREYVLAERLGLEFGEDFRLLQDIGWEPKDGRQAFELTMPPHDLMEPLRRLHDEAEHVLVESGTEREAAEDDARADERFRAGLDACEKVLADLTPERVSGHDRSPSRSALASARPLHRLLVRRFNHFSERWVRARRERRRSFDQLLDSSGDDLRLFDDVGWSSWAWSAIRRGPS